MGHGCALRSRGLLKKEEHGERALRFKGTAEKEFSLCGSWQT